MQQQWALFGGQLGCCTTCRNRSRTDRAIWWKAHARVIPKWPSPQQRKHPAWIKNWEGWSLLSASLSFPMHHSVKLTLWWQTHCCNLYPTSKCSRLCSVLRVDITIADFEREKNPQRQISENCSNFSAFWKKTYLKLNLVIVVCYFGKFLNWKSQVHAEWIWQISCLPCLSVARVIRVTEKSKWQHIYLYVRQINALSLSVQHCFSKLFCI